MSARVTIGSLPDVVVISALPFIKSFLETHRPSGYGRKEGPPQRGLFTSIPLRGRARKAASLSDGLKKDEPLSRTNARASSPRFERLVEPEPPPLPTKTFHLSR